MSDPNRPSPEHRTSVERSRRKWDFWSARERFWDFYERDTLDHRRAAVSRLGLESGDRVVDVGCGPGTNFELLREAVGPAGCVLGVDVSPGMLERAERRIAERGWTNVETVRADATRPVFDAETFDGALATTAVSSTPDVRATVRNVHEALRPDARFAVYEIRLVPAGPARLLNPLVGRFYRAFGNWNGEEDVLDELCDRFAEVTPVEEFALGTNYVAVARKANGGDPTSDAT